jgi:hypothetical protein
VASPGQLVELVSEALGVPRATVALHDRNLAEAGLRKMGGRGPSAAIMDSVDAANLLIAVVAAPINGPAIVSSAATCELYSKLPFREKESSPIRRWRQLLSSLALSPAHTFGEALAALIDAERVGESPESSQPTKNWDFSTLIHAPIPQADFAFSGYKIFVRLVYGDLIPEGGLRRMDWDLARIEKFQARDLEQTRRFRKRTIQRIGRLLGKLPSDGGDAGRPG